MNNHQYFLSYNSEINYDEKIKQIRLKYKNIFEEMSKNIIQKDTIKKEINGVIVEKKQRGRQHVRGYSLKSNGKHWYVYVWGQYDSEESTIMRNQGHKNYTKMDKWECLGRFDDDETFLKLHYHLENKYGVSKEQFFVLVEEMDYEKKKLERDRRIKFNELMNKTLKIAQIHDFEPPTDHLHDLVKIRKIYRQYLMNAIAKVNPLFEFDELPKNPTIDRLETVYEIQCEQGALQRAER